MLTVLETTIRHASDSLELVEGTGLTRRRQTVVDGDTLVVATDLPQAPLSEVADVELVAPPPPADDPDIKPPPPPPDLPGRALSWTPDPLAADPARSQYHGRRQGGRRCSRTAGGNSLPVGGAASLRFGPLQPTSFPCERRWYRQARHSDLPRPPPPVTGDRGGIVSARLRHADGKPASWAVVTARLDLPVANPAHVADRTYRAQADRRGELRLALIGLPAPTKAAVEAGTLDRVLTLSVVADPDVSDADIADPDGFTAMQLRAPDSAAFAAETRFTIRPGGLIRIASEASDHLSLRPIP